MITLVTPANLSPFSSHCCDAMMQAVCNYLVVVVVCTACVFMLGLYEVCNNKCHEMIAAKNILQKYVAQTSLAVLPYRYILLLLSPVPSVLRAQ